MITNRSNLHFLAVLIVTLSLVGPVVADEDLYDFEMVVFERPGGGADEFWPAEPGEPDREAAATRLDSLPGGPKVLGPEAYTLKKKGLIVHEHITWRQAPPDRNSSRWYSIGSARLNGLVRVTRGRFLHLETDLVLNDANTSTPYRIQLRRRMRMRSGELHYVDHPKLGILIQAERHQPVPGAAGSEQAPDGEPKPAQPAAATRPG
ncbi:MAG: hypothetical protein H6957_03475 [Chromatiaceae bacterium]|nr:hypothetical protein [Chromatiaceae bacterium]